MNKLILFTLVIFFLVSCFATFAEANAKIMESPLKVFQKRGIQKKTYVDMCKCLARSVVKCGMGKGDSAKSCRNKYTKSCRTRCISLEKCATKIESLCATHKKDGCDYKICSRGVAAKHCVPQIGKEFLHGCNCNSFSRALCGNAKGPKAVTCRDDALIACKDRCAKDPITKKNEKSRICISSNQCNCVTQAKVRCATSKDAKCIETETNACRAKCQKSTRCYPLSCKSAGAAVCETDAKSKCENVKANAVAHKQCIQDNTKKCQSFEKSNCLKARTLYSIRKQCSKTANTACAKLAGAEKCTCYAKSRQSCIETKLIKREKFIRHQDTCKDRVKKICANRKAAEVKDCYKIETVRCVKKRFRRELIIPKECVETATKHCKATTGICYDRVARKCADQWLSRYCEHKSFNACNGDFKCMKQEIDKCSKTLPKCWNNRQACNDKNPCTIDVCDPKVGCLNVPKTCDDKNLCTKDICDPKKGCVHTAKDCNDKIDCTVDSCDPKNGVCSNVPNHSKCTSDKKCTSGICSAKGCVFHVDAKCETPDIPALCAKECKPSNPCETVNCQVDKNLKVNCARTTKVCDDKKSCTADYCDTVSGKCVHKKLNDGECAAPACEINADCSAWSLSMKLTEKCLVSVCEPKLGVCTAVPCQNQECVPVDLCKQVCKPRDECDVAARCTREKGAVKCIRPESSCDDGDKCTVDSCNVKTGECQHIFKECDVCTARCDKDDQCAAWAKKKNLADDCKDAVCDTKTRLCKVVPKDPSQCVRCDANCKSTNPCETAKCVGSICHRTKKECNDNNACTFDYCDPVDGNCVYRRLQDEEKCTLCTVDNDCKAWGAKRAVKCKNAVCDSKNKVCVHAPLADEGKCECDQACAPNNKCDLASCIKEGVVYKCKHVAKSCSDNNECTADSCDAVTGKCINVFKKTAECSTVCEKSCKPNHPCDTAKCVFANNEKGWECVHETKSCADTNDCTKDSCDAVTGKCLHEFKLGCVIDCDKECKPSNGCESAKCVQADNGKGWKCERSIRSCDDKDSCTKDSCDLKTGKCVNEFVEGPQCKKCDLFLDCIAWGKNNQLAKVCKKPICDLGTRRCVAVEKTNKSECPKCINCAQRSLCELSVDCILDENNKPACERVVNKCDDNNSCTVDYCDTKNGKCIHSFKESRTCKKCLVDDKECAAWGQSNKLHEICHEAICNKNTGTCVAIPSKDQSKCTDKCINCKSSPCEIATCVFDENKKPVCIRSKKSCDDNKPCTMDRCNPTTGACEHAEGLCPICSKDGDCFEWAKAKKLGKCEFAYCDTDLAKCVIKKSQSEVCINECINCKASPCEEATCVFENDKAVCKRVPISCDDGCSCTKDTCDIKTGKCMNTFVEGPTCKKCTPAKQEECAKMTVSLNLKAVCKEAVCNEFTQQCEIRDSKDQSTCVPPICDKECVRANACETAVCEFDEMKVPFCKRTKTICNDNNECTVDSCDSETGNCVHVLKESATCKPCDKDLDCDAWGVSNKLADSCKVALCDKDQGVCVSAPSKDQSKCPTECIDCVPAHKCETVKCVKKDGKPVCERSPLACADGDDCTEDCCNQATGCVFKLKQNDKRCKPCIKDLECTAWGLSLNLKDECEEPFCNTQLHRCDKRPVANKDCIKKTDCDKICQPNHKCESVGCVLNEKKQLVCNRVENKCNDDKKCTFDYCVKETGKCQNDFKKSLVCDTKCEDHLDCAAWGKEKNLIAICQQPKCDEKLGTCVAVPLPTLVKCEPDCKLACKPKDQCEDMKCKLDDKMNFVCLPSPKTCDDNKSCTQDSCDPIRGCQHEFKVTKECPKQCIHDDNCAEWGKTQSLTSCEAARCNQKSGSCEKVIIPGKTCPTSCPLTEVCKPKNKCELTNLVIPSEDPSKCTCERTTVTCDDKKSCTQDICEPTTGGCKNVFVHSDKCIHPCEKDCVSFAIQQQLHKQCKTAVCDEPSGSCVIVDDNKSNCKQCQLDCKSSKCESAECVLESNGNFKCSRTENKCDDKKQCTKDSCNKSTGECVHEKIASKECEPPLCDKDLDCTAWGIANKLSADCRVPACDNGLGVCKAIAGKNCTHECEKNSDCPETKYGSVCIDKKCVPEECDFDSDCRGKRGDPNKWVYCKEKRYPGLKECVPEDKCKDSMGCDDKNPCTLDVCLPEYGYCSHHPRCDDHNECTTDVCLPSSDKTTYTCSNNVKTCTLERYLLDKNLKVLNYTEQVKWVGKCDKEKGCQGCVVNAQCDDNNGCTNDSCIDQVCIHQPIHNEWCDPKISGQPINFQSIPGLRDKLKLAGYDLDKLVK